MTLVTALILVAVLGSIALLALAPAAPSGDETGREEGRKDTPRLKTVPGQRSARHHTG
ncbi:MULTISPECIES: hypothetical protein [Streptomyces]|uniref:hypothetical protein n=1 Tax=Streptomyces TaxID=1883 RepID=UPI001576D3A5|nr:MULTISPECIES: hypothetical protein [Streptomyces]